eukprot:5970088-Amphidinium_carterae.1
MDTRSQTRGLTDICVLRVEVVLVVIMLLVLLLVVVEFVVMELDVETEVAVVALDFDAPVPSLTGVDELVVEDELDEKLVLVTPEGTNPGSITIAYLLPASNSYGRLDNVTVGGLPETFARNSAVLSARSSVAP